MELHNYAKRTIVVGTVDTGLESFHMSFGSFLNLDYSKGGTLNGKSS